MKKKIISMLLLICMLFQIIPATVFALDNETSFKVNKQGSIYNPDIINDGGSISSIEHNTTSSVPRSDMSIKFYENQASTFSLRSEQEETVRYSILVLDTSSSSDFVDSSGNVFYTADTAISYVKTASKKFISDIQKASGTNYVAIVEYKGSNANIVSEFSTDYTALSSKIDSLYASEGTRSVSLGLETAYSLLKKIADDTAKRNVVLFTTGMTNEGDYTYDGIYNEDTVGSNWRRLDTQIRLYAYANAAINQADKIKDNAMLYSVGLFQTMENMPDEGEDIVEFFKLFASDIATSEEYFYDVNDPRNLEFVFGEIADDMTGVDTDGDGLLDSWEINGLDIDGDGIIDVPLNKMGADPNIPDIFIEVDWMVQPEKKILGFTTQKRISLAPSESAMRIVYNSFKEHGINIHIDAGPDSIDFVTGKKWGSLSGGNEINYEKNFSLGLEWSHWSDVAKDNFTKKRATTFRHCIFVNQYDGGTSSGIASGIPGQYFLVANQSWVRDTGDTGVAGTFMHELGHTLGLSHGGFDHAGNNNHVHYKPNYLSIMNYLFQTSGLSGTRGVNYSDYTLPDIDENTLYEPNGIDPNMVTAGSGIGTKLQSSGKTFAPIAGMGIDFDGWWGIEDKTVSVDLNGDGIKTVLTGTRDWDNIIYRGGNIGFSGQIVQIKGITQPEATQNHELSELTYEEALDNGVLGYVGSGALEDIGPYTLLSGHDGQSVYVQVKNLANEPVDFTLLISESPLNSESLINISLKASTENINYTEIPISIKNHNIPGSYSISASLLYENTEIAHISVPVEISDIPNEELKKLLDDETIYLPNIIRDEYEKILSKEGHSIFSYWSNDNLSHWHDCSCGNKHDTATHTSSEWIIDLEATSNTAGSRHKECTVCSYVIVVESIPANGSNFNYNNWYWALMMLNNQEYKIIASTTDGGTITPVGISKVKYDKNITYTITPNEGYEIADVLVDGKSVGAVSEYTIKRVKAEHTINAIFSKTAWKNPYTDVSSEAWYYEDVEFVNENDLMIGTFDNKFSPSTIVNRAMLVTVLWRLESSPIVDSPVDFYDVPADEWYTTAVNWAAANGIANGYGDGIFGATNDLTHEQIMAILNRYAVYKKWSENVSGNADDSYTNSDWAENNILWADLNGMFDGIGSDISDLTESADRAELAAYLRRFCERFMIE